MKLSYLLNAFSMRRLWPRGELSLKLLLPLCLACGIFITWAVLAVTHYLNSRNDGPLGPPQGFTGSGKPFMQSGVFVYDAELGAYQLTGIGKPLFQPGTRMPDFTLPLATGDGEVGLARLRGDGKPVVLVFASFTCTVFRDYQERVEALFHKYQDQAHFLFVNIREAGHEIEGFEYLLSEKPGSGKGKAQRCGDVDRAAKMVGLTMPIVVDVEDQVVKSYNAWPLRLMVLDAKGEVALDLGIGTQGIWELDRVEKWLGKPASAAHTERNAESALEKIG